MRCTRFALPWSNLVFVLAKQGQDDTVIAQFERIVKAAASNQYFLGILGHYYASVGRREDAQRVLDQLHALSAQRWVSAFWPAVISACLGRMDEAFTSLYASYWERAPWLPYSAAPHMDVFRADTRFEELLRKVNSSALSGQGG